MPPRVEQMKWVSTLFLAGMVFFMASAQVMFKFAGNHSVGQVELVGSFISNPWLWAGLLLSGAGMVCWIRVLRGLPLARAYPWTALIYVITPLASAALFGDVLSGRYLLGLVCIVAGVFIANGGVVRDD
jgi:drug/metabolite transporter (DMT)-like permease